jgi:hypothetical protein
VNDNPNGCGVNPIYSIIIKLSFLLDTTPERDNIGLADKK